MSYELIVSDEATFDITEAVFWYNTKRDNLGDAFIAEIEVILLKLIDTPELFQIRYRNVHIAFSTRFPYGVHYIIQNSIIKIIAVFHTSKNPTSWLDRL